MATANVKARCSICEEERNTFICRGCSKDFCINHLPEHLQLLNTQFHHIQNDYNEFKQTIIDLKNNPQKHFLIKEIDQWEIISINKIKQRAQQCREILINYTNQIVNSIEIQLNNSNEQLISNQKKNDFNEIDLDQLKDKLNKLKQELNQSTDVSVKQQINSLIDRICIKFASNDETCQCPFYSLEQQLVIPNLNINQIWKQHGTTIAGGHGYGNQLNQLDRPCGVYIDDDQTIYVADTSNHRIVEWKKNAINGQIVAGGNEAGNRDDQLNNPTKVIIDKENDSLIICGWGNRRVVRWPHRNAQSGKTLISKIDCRDLIMDNDGYLYVCDQKKHEVRRWKMGEIEGTIIAGGNGEGNRLDQLNNPRYIFIDEDHSVYVSDCLNHRVMKWVKGAKEGIVVAGGQGQGNGLKQLLNPQGILVDQLGSVYVADGNNDRVIRWLKGAKEGTIIVGGNERGEQSNQFNYPTYLSFDRQNNLYVVDWGNHRVQKFDVDLD